MPATDNHLLQRIEKLEKENAMLRRDFSRQPGGDTVSVQQPLRPVFDVA